MKYAIIKVSNGNYEVYSEGITDITNAKVQFHGVCQSLWNAKDVVTASVAIVNEQLNIVDGYKEFIRHEQPRPEPTPEPEPEPTEGEGE